LEELPQVKIQAKIAEERRVELRKLKMLMRQYFCKHLTKLIEISITVVELTVTILKRRKMTRTDITMDNKSDANLNEAKLS